ncbi:patatin-like phospholipase family protein [Carboxylicivirga marina]|uniref:Patatin-like phospholipase family protein n=1 Tax=Carboxylicivirga marina TaxID=2800988 RepID=A0ABS1HNQ2_9BACT|nr:patatin-like phospholipase family protein [Carboxylicivirga marina]MBK3519325.1 patatin-like phospholipase family protein [Carboxylicivirga marina]
MKHLGKVGLALGGGGAKGFAHIGVLQALEEYKIPVHKIAGTSMGAIVGVLYSAGFNAGEILELLRKEKVWNWFKIDILRGGLVNLTGAKETLIKHVSHEKFDQLTIPFSVTASNLNTGKVKVVNQGGKLFDWVMASCSVPVAFTPVTIDGYTYVDGGIFMNLPAEPLMFECDTVIGSSVIVDKKIHSIKNAKDVAERVFNLSIIQNERISKLHCDYFLGTKKLNDYSMWDFNHFEEIVAIGYKTAKKKIERDWLASMQNTN